SIPISILSQNHLDPNRRRRKKRTRGPGSNLLRDVKNLVTSRTGFPASSAKMRFK
ncbi:hypothetical protein P692DRAFT_20835170, partial [Suillus brevipes Sb2]